MNFSYVGYAEDRSIVSGKVSAPTEELARQTLSRSRYRVLSIKPATSFMPTWDNLLPSLFGIKPEAIIMLCRQLALLLESGTDIVTALDLLQTQSTNGTMKRVLGEITVDLRNGNRLSAALSKHPKVFSKMLVQSLIVGEQSGGLEKVLRQMANYMEKENVAAKQTKNALKYPMFVSGVSIVVIIVMITFVFPSFAGLYSSMGAKLPAMTSAILSLSLFMSHNWPYLLGAIAAITALAYAYARTASGRRSCDSIALQLPMLGRIAHLSELARCCRSMSLLLGAGLPLPQIMSLVTEGTTNTILRESLNGVKESMLKGEGLSQPMSRDPLFMPMMVQMVNVGEKTGNLDVTLLSVAESYETEAQDRTRAFIGMIQPVTTIIIAAIVAVIALSLVSVMYSLYGQIE